MMGVEGRNVQLSCALPEFILDPSSLPDGTLSP